MLCFLQKLLYLGVLSACQHYVLTTSQMSIHFIFLDLVPNVMTIAFQMFYFCMKT
jgi:hypothetical protein